MLEQDMARLDAEFAVTNTTLTNMATMTSHNVNVVVPVAVVDVEAETDERPGQVPDVRDAGGREDARGREG